MTPAKRQNTPVSQGPKRAPAPKVPDVPSAPPRRRRPVPDELMTAPAPPAAAKDGAQLLGPEGEPIAQDAPREDAGGELALPTQIGQVDAEDRATTRSPRRSGSFYPLPVWPD